MTKENQIVLPTTSSEAPLPPAIIASESEILSDTSYGLSDTDSVGDVTFSSNASYSPLGSSSLPFQPPIPENSTHSMQLTVNVALCSRIATLEAENVRLKALLADRTPRAFRIESIANNDSLVKLYTGFPSYEILISFFEFLGSSVNCLEYWGKTGQ